MVVMLIIPGLSLSRATGMERKPPELHKKDSSKERDRENELKVVYIQ